MKKPDKLKVAAQLAFDLIQTYIPDVQIPTVSQAKAPTET